jgi:hypothetical protein
MLKRSFFLSSRNFLKPGVSGSVCNPSYSGGRNQEDCGSKPTWANSRETLSRKKLLQKRAGEWLQVEALSSSPSTPKQQQQNFRDTQANHNLNKQNINSSLQNFQIKIQVNIK